MTIKFMCLNLWSEGNILNNAIAYINKERPDILAAQEAWNSKDKDLPENFKSMPVIMEKCSYAYSTFAEALIDNNGGNKFPSGNAIYSRWPKTEHKPVFFDQEYGERFEQTHEAYSVTPRNLQYATIHTGYAELNVFNTQGVWDLDGDKVTERRIKMCNALAKAIKGKQNVILAGDFNLKPSNKALAPLDSQLTSVFKNERANSFNLRRKDLDKYPGYASAAVDLMYVTPDIKVIKYSCPNVDVSDHLPLVAELEIQ
jgi:endonuclease/exonuclease/phosphatase family metal-dependent hydrolase